MPNDGGEPAVAVAYGTVVASDVVGAVGTAAEAVKADMLSVLVGSVAVA